MLDFAATILKKEGKMYFGDCWDSKEDVALSFQKELGTNIQIVFACYVYEDYTGDAHVLYYDTNDKNYYEVHGGHCSCYGLEDQWEPYQVDVNHVIRELEDTQAWCYGTDKYNVEMLAALREFMAKLEE